jgi:hypothetical protein
MATVSGTNFGNIALELVGKPAGWLRRLQPPGYETTQVAAPTGEPVLAESAGRFTVTPVDADFAFAGAGPLLDWALTLPRKLLVAIDGAIQLLDRNYRVARRIEWSQGLLTELRLPELDATSKSPFTVGLTWQPEAIRFARASLAAGTTRPGKSKTVLLSNFRVVGLPFDASAVIRVALPTVRAKIALETFGTHRPPQQHSASVDLGDVRLEIGARSADAVRDWVVKVIGDGTVTDDERINFGIELLDSSLKNVLATITLGGCALTGYAEFELTAAAEKPANVALRFSVGDLDIKAAA